MEDDASRRFIDVWHRAERGESFHERHLAFAKAGMRWPAFSLASAWSLLPLRAASPCHQHPCFGQKRLSRDYSMSMPMSRPCRRGLLDNSAKACAPTTMPSKQRLQF